MKICIDKYTSMDVCTYLSSYVCMYNNIYIHVIHTYIYHLVKLYYEYLKLVMTKNRFKIITISHRINYHYI